MPAPEESRAEAERHIDNVVMSLLLRGPWPWSARELAQELGNEIEALDALQRLASHGLAHRLEDFAFPTRAARRAAEIAIGTG